MHIAQLLFSYHGRISPKLWWISQILVWVFAAATTWIYHTFGLHDAIVSAVLTVVVFVMRLFINIKRLHDQGISGWWLLALELPGLGWGLAALTWIIPVYGFLLSAFFGTIALAGFIATTYVLGIRKGHDGANQHGEPVHSVSLSSTKNIVPLLLLCLFIAGCAGAVAVEEFAASEAGITTIELATLLFKKVVELHEAGVDQKIMDEVNDAISQAHAIVDRHHEEHIGE